MHRMSEPSDFSSQAESLQLRSVVLADASALFQWRNHPLVRTASLGTEEISWETHLAWLTASLQNPHRQLLIGEYGGVPVGVLRFDCHATQALVSIYLVPEKMGQGYGVRLLLAGREWVQQMLPTVLTIRAEIRSENSASIKTFEKAGYQPSGPEAFAALEKGILIYEYTF